MDQIFEEIDTNPGLKSSSDVSDDLIRFFERLKTVSYIKRFGTLPMIQDESVAGHSYNVAMLAMLIADYEKSDKINMDAVFRKALLHDFEESILSDIPHSIKHRYKDGRLAKLLKEIVPDLIDEELFKELPDYMRKKYSEAAKGSKEGTEGEIVEAADAMDTTLTSLRELKLGNQYFERVFEASIALTKKHDNFKFVKIFLEKALSYKLNASMVEDI